MYFLHLDNVECSEMINLEKELYSVSFKATLPNVMG